MLIPQLRCGPSLASYRCGQRKTEPRVPSMSSGRENTGGGCVPGPARRLGAPRETRCNRRRDRQRICPAPAPARVFMALLRFLVRTLEREGARLG